jgi:hypothetical protein
VHVLTEQERLERDIVARICHYRGPLWTGHLDFDTPNELINTAMRGVKRRTKRGLSHEQNDNVKTRVAELDVRSGNIGGILDKPSVDPFNQMKRYAMRYATIRTQRESAVIYRGENL